MTRLLVLGTVAVLATLVVVSVTTSARTPRHHGHSGKRIHVIEHATTDAVVDLGAPGDSAGDTLTFANDVFGQADVVKVGTDQGSCIRTVVGEAWECAWTTLLRGDHGRGVRSTMHPTASSQSQAERAPTATPAVGWI